MNRGITEYTLATMAGYYQSQGLRIFPVRPGVREPYKLASWGDKLRKSSMVRLPTVDQIHDFWDIYPEANIAFFPGPESRVSVIDLDVKKHVDGRETLKRNGLGFLIDAALKVHTPSGGLHLYFKYTTTLPDYANAAETHGIDIRNSTKGYILLPPSSAVPKYSQGGNTFVEYRFEGIEPYEFQKDLLPDFPDIPNPDFFHQLGSGSSRRKKTNSKKRPYAELPSTYLPPGSFRAKAIWSKEAVDKNRRREKNKNAIKGQLGNSKIVQLTNNQKKLQQLASERGDAYEGEKPLTLKQAKKAAKGIVKRAKKQRFLVIPPSRNWNFTRVYFNYVIGRTKHWVLLNFKNKFESDGSIPDLWISPENGTTYVRYNSEMVPLNLKEKYPVDRYIDKDIPPPIKHRLYYQ